MIKNITLLLILFVFSCKETKSTDVGEVHKTDSICFNEIEKAKADFDNGKRSYYLLRGFDMKLHSEDEFIIKNFKKLNIKASVVGVSCIEIENMKLLCYEREMNFLVEKELGKTKLDAIFKNSIDDYVKSHNLKITKYTKDGIVFLGISIDEQAVIPFGHRYLTFKEIPPFLTVAFELEKENLYLDVEFYSDFHPESEGFTTAEEEFITIVKSNLKKEVKNLKLPDGGYYIVVKI